MSATVGRCVMPGCFRTVTGNHRCYLHELAIPPRDAEYEAALVVDRERAGWDVFDDGGLEARGDDEWD